MPTLSAGQLASMRIAAENSLTSAVLPDGTPSIVEIRENQKTRNGMCGTKDSWVTVRSYPCTVVAMAPLLETVQGGKVQAVTRYKFSLPSDAQVDPSNRLLWNGVEFDVKAADIPTASSIEVEVFAVRLN